MTALRHAPPKRIGRYAIEQPLARGGMAELYVARHDALDKRVALKRVLPELARDAEFVELFVREARIAGSLAHHNIVAVHDIGSDADGHFFAMELLHGADVGALLRANDDEVPLEVVLAIASGACAGLHHAHERRDRDGAPLGIVHRDVSPQNLFVTFDGCVKVLDFGIAKAVDGIRDRATRTGTLRGKIPYMSPEQCHGEPLDRRTDIFSLGIVLWELLAKERLFGARGESDFEVMKQITERAIPPIGSKRAVPAAIGALIDRALAANREDRFATIGELGEAIDRAAREYPMSSRELGAYVAKSAPDRVAAWERGEIAVEAERSTRATVELRSSLSGKGMGTGKGTSHDESSAGSSSPNVPLPMPLPMPDSPTRRPLVLVAVLVAAAAIALVAGIAIGRRGSPTSSSVPIATTPAGSAVTTIATPGAGSAPFTPPAEDAHWFQPDDYLVTPDPLIDGRNDALHIAKQLSPGHFLDGTGATIVATTSIRSRIATAADLSIGTLAICRVDKYMLAGTAPRDKAEARTREWALARVTDVSDLARGRVTIADAVCDITGVRIPLDH